LDINVLNRCFIPVRLSYYDCGKRESIDDRTSGLLDSPRLGTT